MRPIFYSPDFYAPDMIAVKAEQDLLGELVKLVALNIIIIFYVRLLVCRFWFLS